MSRREAPASGQRRSGRTDRVGRGAVLVAVAAAPVVFTVRSLDPFFLPKLVVEAVAVAASMVAFAIGTRRRPSIVPTVPRIAWAVAAVVAATSLATAFSSSVALSAWGGFGRYGGLGPLLIHVGAAAAVVCWWWRRPGSVDAVTTAILAGSVGLALYILAQAVGIDAWRWIDEVGNPVRYHFGSMGNSNFAGGQLAIALPLVVGLYRARRGTPLRWAAVTLLAIILAAGLLATASRGGLVAAVVGTSVAFVLGARPGRRLRAAGVAALLVATAGTAVVAIDPGVLRTDSAGHRVRSWSASARMFADHPLTGVGPDAFVLHYPRYRDVVDARILRSQITDKPHNVVLERLATGGLPLIVATMLLLVATIGLGRRAVAAGTSVLAPAVCGAIAAYWTQAAVSIDVPPLALLGWVLLAVLAVLADPALDRRRGESPASRPRHQTRVWNAVAALFLSLATVAVVNGAADLAAATARRDPVRAREGAERAAEMFPLQLRYRLDVAAFAQPELARKRYDEVLRMVPEELTASTARARAVQVAAPGSTSAVAAWRQVAKLDPHGPDSLLGFASAVVAADDASASDVTAARRAARHATEVLPDAAVTWATLAEVDLLAGDDTAARMALQRARTIRPDDPSVSRATARLNQKN